MTRTEKIAANKLERRINATASKAIAGMSIDIFDLSKIAKVGKDAAAAGKTDAEMIAAMMEFANTIRKDV